MSRLLNKIQLLRGLITGQIAKTGPFFVDIDLTSRCNLHCVSCIYHSPHLNGNERSQSRGKDFSPALFHRLCKELKKIGTHTLVLQGSGEPTLHADLPEMIAVARRMGYQVELITNGTLLDLKKSKALIDSGLSRLKVSLWASSKTQYEWVYPGTDPAFFDRVLNGIRTIDSLKRKQNYSHPLIMLYQPLGRHNFKAIDEIIDLALESRANGLLLSPLGTALGEVGQLALNKNEEGIVRKSLAKAKLRLESLGLEHNINQVLSRYSLGPEVWKTVPCYISWFHARLRVDGTVEPCGRCDSTVNFGNINEHAFSSIWNGSAIRRFRNESMTLKGLAAIGEYCDCRFCCYVIDNLRIHRTYRWIAPSIRRTTR